MSSDVERRRLLGPSIEDSDSEPDGNKEINSYYRKLKKNKEDQGLTKNLVLAILSCVIGSSFQFGYNTGVVNAPELVIQQFYNKTYYERYSEYLPEDELTLLWAVTVAIFTVGGMVGGVSAGFWGNRYGRTAPSFYTPSTTVIGINTGLAPLYLSEIAPVSLRGMSGTINQLAITVGALVSQVLGMKLALGTTDLWSVCLGLTIIPVMFQLLTLSFCPESPRYLMLSRDNKQGATDALVWLRKTSDVSDELLEMQLEKEEQQRATKFSVMDLFRQRELRIPLLISLVLQLSQQFSGINAVIMYSTSIFMNAGLDHSDAQYATVGTGVVNMLMTFVSALLVDRAGRRTLHLIGLGGMFVFSLVLSVAIVYQHEYQWLSYICIVAVLCYIISFATGPGAIPWFYVAELFAQGPRSAAVSIAVLVNWSANFVVSLVFPIVQKAIADYSFIPFVILLAIFWLFTFFKVPETKGRTFDEISKAFLSSPQDVKTDDAKVLLAQDTTIQDAAKSVDTPSALDTPSDPDVVVNDPSNAPEY
ncbi:solute carrier family 2, facilitated glucose transporter member 3-like [Gigantopelta aegis]|uniref:solute carrier family 2, facilitated glucose transporter member 3-like n=1 Tax=Gigantopelta aegis TaxID=1735272 RepID=UPI001B888CE3|nr:solute carrier family 2, facilitated glucose transporter member 3-like [Gigantopelta aegis]